MEKNVNGLKKKKWMIGDNMILLRRSRRCSRVRDDDPRFVYGRYRQPTSRSPYGTHQHTHQHTHQMHEEEGIYETADPDRGSNTRGETPDSERYRSSITNQKAHENQFFQNDFSSFLFSIIPQQSIIFFHLKWFFSSLFTINLEFSKLVD